MGMVWVLDSRQTGPWKLGQFCSNQVKYFWNRSLLQIGHSFHLYVKVTSDRPPPHTASYMYEHGTVYVFLVMYVRHYLALMVPRKDTKAPLELVMSACKAKGNELWTLWLCVLFVSCNMYVFPTDMCIFCIVQKVVWGLECIFWAMSLMEYSFPADFPFWLFIVSCYSVSDLVTLKVLVATIDAQWEGMGM